MNQGLSLTVWFAYWQVFVTDDTRFASQLVMFALGYCDQHISASLVLLQ